MTGPVRCARSEVLVDPPTSAVWGVCPTCGRLVDIVDTPPRWAAHDEPAEVTARLDAAAARVGVDLGDALQAFIRNGGTL